MKTELKNYSEDEAISLNQMGFDWNKKMGAWEEAYRTEPYFVWKENNTWKLAKVTTHNSLRSVYDSSNAIREIA